MTPAKTGPTALRPLAVHSTTKHDYAQQVPDRLTAVHAKPETLFVASGKHVKVRLLKRSIQSCSGAAASAVHA